MRLKHAGLLAATVGLLLTTAAPATAERLGVTDPSGDTDGRGLDIVRASVANRDYRIVVRVRFTKEVRGDVIVSVDRRHGQGLRLVSEHRPSGKTTNFVLPGAFTDTSATAKEVTCSGFRVRWLEDRPVVRMRLPARCLHDGNYGAVRFGVLTERRADTDYAPGTAPHASRWIPRG